MTNSVFSLLTSWEVSAVGWSQAIEVNNNDLCKIKQEDVVCLREEHSAGSGRLSDIPPHGGQVCLSQLTKLL